MCPSRHIRGISGTSSQTLFEGVLVHRFFFRAIVAGLGLSAAIGAPAAERRAVTHEDIWLMPRVAAPVVSPDGKNAVFSVTDPAYNADQQASDVWLVATDGKSP